MKLTSRTLIALAGGAALAVAAGAQAGPHGGGGPMPGAAAGGGFPTGLGRGPGEGLPPAVNPGISTRDQARANREGPEHASPTGVANANENAGLSSATTSDLSGLKTGLTVKDSTGTVVGTVKKIEKSEGGIVRNVLVASADGRRTIRLAPAAISVSGDVVTATSLPKK